VGLTNVRTSTDNGHKVETLEKIPVRSTGGTANDATELEYIRDLQVGVRSNDAVIASGTSDKNKRYRAFQRWCLDNGREQSVPSCFAWLHEGVSLHGWTTPTVYKYRNAVLTYLQLNERVRESAMSLKLRGRKREVIELDTKREQRTAPFADVVPLLIHRDVEIRLAMWITILSGARSGDIHATANSPALSLDRVNIARSDERMITLDFNGITKTTNTESAILREDHLVFVALPSELHAYVMRKKRRLPPASPLLLPSTKFSPSHLYKLRITKFHVLRDIFAKHISALNPRHTSATYMSRSNGEAALVSRGMDALALLLSYHVQTEAKLISGITFSFPFSSQEINAAVATLESVQRSLLFGRLSPIAKARLQSCSAPMASSWLAPLPGSDDPLWLPSSAFITLLRFRLGLPISTANSRCVMCDQIADNFGYHSVTCANGRYGLHNTVRDSIFAMAAAANWAPSLEPHIIPEKWGTRADILARIGPTTNQTDVYAIDVAVIAAHAKVWLRSAIDHPAGAANKYENQKVRKYGARRDHPGVTVIGCVVDMFGAWVNKLPLSSLNLPTLGVTALTFILLGQSHLSSVLCPLGFNPELPNFSLPTTRNTAR
jgi:hypothetical protein